MTQQAKKIKQFEKLDPDAPVLPSLASLMDVELVVSEDHSVMVIVSKELLQSYWWAEYDIDLQQLYFVTVEGKIQGLGMKVHEPFEDNMTDATDIRLVRFNQKTKKMSGLPYIVPLVVRKHTLQDPSND
jgi:hypothetical protein